MNDAQLTPPLPQPPPENDATAPPPPDGVVETPEKSQPPMLAIEPAVSEEEPSAIFAY